MDFVANSNWSFNGTLTRYGRYTSYLSNISQYDTRDKYGNLVTDQTFSPKWVLDLSGSYRWQDWTFTLGVDNASDTYPDRNIATNTNAIALKANSADVYTQSAADAKFVELAGDNMSGTLASIPSPRLRPPAG